MVVQEDFVNGRITRISQNELTNAEQMIDIEGESVEDEVIIEPLAQEPQQQSFAFVDQFPRPDSSSPWYAKFYKRTRSTLDGAWRRMSKRTAAASAAVAAGLAGMLLGYCAPHENTLQRTEYVSSFAPVEQTVHVRLPVDLPIEKHLWDVGKNGYAKAEEKARKESPDMHVSAVYVEYVARSGERVREVLHAQPTDREIANAVKHIQEANRLGVEKHGKHVDYLIGPERAFRLVRDGAYNKNGMFVGTGPVREVRQGEVGDELADIVRKDYPVRVFVEGEYTVPLPSRVSGLEREVGKANRVHAMPGGGTDAVQYAISFNYGWKYDDGTRVADLEDRAFGERLELAKKLYVNEQVSNVANRQVFMSIEDICEATGIGSRELRDCLGGRRDIQEDYRAQRRANALALRKTGMSYQRIAGELGVSYSTARRDVLRMESTGFEPVAS